MIIVFETINSITLLFMSLAHIYLSGVLPCSFLIIVSPEWGWALSKHLSE